MENANTEVKNNVTLSFNPAAVSAFMAKEEAGTRFRMQVKDNTLFIRPTDRVKGPHVFADYPSTPAAGSSLKVTVTEDQLAKLGHKLESGEEYGIAEHKYGWFFLTAKGEGIEGAKAKVGKAA